MMQQAGASARERLKLAAADRWKVAPTDCTVASGKCLHKATSRSLDYGALAAAAALVQLPAEPAIKAPDKYRLVGKWTPRLDTAAKLDGSAKFGIDAQVPGMVYAAVWSAPVYGGSLKAVDDQRPEGHPRDHRGRREAEGRRGGRGGPILARQEGSRCAEDRMGRWRLWRGR